MKHFPAPKGGMVALMIGCSLVFTGCAKVAPNLPVAGGPPLMNYPFEPKDLYNSTYPADAQARQALRDQEIRKKDAGVVRIPAPAPGGVSY